MKKAVKCPTCGKHFNGSDAPVVCQNIQNFGRKTADGRPIKKVCGHIFKKEERHDA